MPKKTDLQSLVAKFAEELEAAVTARVNDEFAARFDDFRSRILGGEKVAPRTVVATGGKAAGKRRGPRAGSSAPSKPCPVCSEPTKARRYSYLCEKHRSDENLKKFKNAKVAAKAAGKKRGPGRPKGSGKGRGRKAATPAPTPAAS
jgi:hypothetical protein